MKIYIALSVWLVFACASSKKPEPTPALSSWKEMDQFHMILAELYHPFKDSANLQPTKTRYEELARSAESWTKAALPPKVNNEKTKSKLQLLTEETRELLGKIQRGTDEEISKSLEELHNTFHEVQEIWYRSDAPKHHEH